jgi:preprotein translocase subunit YajC
VLKNKRIIIVLAGLLIAGMSLLTSCYGLTGTTSSGASTTVTTTSSGGGFDWTLIIFLVVIFAILYFLMIRPQRNRQKQMKQMMEDLKRGDHIITTSGIYGTIDVIEETSFVIKLEDGTRMRVVKNAIAGKRPET